LCPLEPSPIRSTAGTEGKLQTSERVRTRTRNLKTK
jgi:hypothetical protein